ncbi:hypothetical protein TNCV_4799961 [Trichonephila clavipes]|uniref:Uncharacterized protein n=1 Tax=Trichonephila clavipes TaxID=2585209 RepID=A0A8X6RLP4_TRICX|nr:hypothetical protein TNCV_4799961 [Trichonephila clavipes]
MNGSASDSEITDNFKSSASESESSDDGFVLLPKVETDQAIEEPTEIMLINQDSESKYQKSVRDETFELI